MQLFSLKCDLDAVRRYCRVAREELFSAALRPHSTWTFECVYSAMAVRYRRCFSQGKRGECIPSDCLRELSPVLKQWHARTIALADGFYAHALDLVEKGRVTITAQTDNGTRTLGSVGHSHTSLAGLGSEFASAVDALCLHALAWVHRELTMAKTKVQTWAIELPAEVIASLESDASDPPFTWEKVDARIDSGSLGVRRNQRRRNRRRVEV